MLDTARSSRKWQSALHFRDRLIASSSGEHDEQVTTLTTICLLSASASRVHDREAERAYKHLLGNSLKKEKNYSVVSTKEHNEQSRIIAMNETIKNMHTKYCWPASLFWRFSSAKLLLIVEVTFSLPGASITGELRLKSRKLRHI